MLGLNNLNGTSTIDVKLFKTFQINTMKMKIFFIMCFSFLLASETTAIYRVDGMMCGKNCPIKIKESLKTRIQKLKKESEKKILNWHKKKQMLFILI